MGFELVYEFQSWAYHLLPKRVANVGFHSEISAHKQLFLASTYQS